MSIDWNGIILDAPSPAAAWTEIFAALLALSKATSSPVALHDATVVPDRLLAEAAWELWEAFPLQAGTTADHLKAWATAGSAGKAVLILDALSLRELPILLGAAETRGVEPVQVRVTGSASRSTRGIHASSSSWTVRRPGWPAQP